jgi:hypothetical protein
MASGNCAARYGGREKPPFPLWQGNGIWHLVPPTRLAEPVLGPAEGRTRGLGTLPVEGREGAKHAAPAIPLLHIGREYPACHSR